MMEPAVLGRLAARTTSVTPRYGEPITAGVPLPRGRVRDVATLVAVAGEALPTQARALEHWSDGSVRWALLDTRVDLPPEGAEILVRDDLPVPESPYPLALSLSARSASVTSGPCRIDLDLDHGHPFTAVLDDGRPVIDAPLASVLLCDAEGRSIPVRFAAIEAEVTGPLRVVLRVDGEASGPEGARLNVDLRLTFLAGLPVMGIELSLHNPRAAVHPGGLWELGDAGSVLLRDAVVRLPLSAPLQTCRASLERDAPLTDVALPFSVTQHSSGGEHWASAAHVNRAGEVTLDHRGYTARAGATDSTGLRANPVLVAGLSGDMFCVAAERFWEVFPKALEVHADGVLGVSCLPAGRAPHELQGGERCDYEFWIAWGADGVSDTPLEWRRAPASVLPEAQAVAVAELVPSLEPARSGEGSVYERLIGAALDGPDTFAAKREQIDEYGWRHYGDLYADHENAPGSGHQIVSHYNNQYDAVYGLALQALRHDDHRWWELARDLARHVSRIDVYWTSEDRAAYNGGLFWHTAHYTAAGRSTHRTYPRDAGLDGGGPSNEHCYSHGLLLHYFLTGDPTSRDAVLSLANWVIAMDDGRRARWPLPWLCSSPTGGASATVSGDYHGPGRGAANAVLTLLDAHRLTGDERFIAKADELVRRVVHPADDLDALALLDAERRWSYTVLLQALGRYLSTRRDLGRCDERWDYARAVILHYARWMADHEHLYLEQPDRLEFPTETWAAQDVRKSEVFDLAALYAATDLERRRFLDCAREFHRRALEMLAAMPTRTRTRPVVLLLSYGFSRPWFEDRVLSLPLYPPEGSSWPAPSRFVPQRAIAVRRLWRLAVSAALVATLALLRWAL